MPSPLRDEPFSNLRPVTRFITTHRPDGKATVHSATSPPWEPKRDGAVAFSLLYTTSVFPSELSADADISAHEAVAADPAASGLVRKGGSVCRICDFASSNDPLMHRTKSLDYGVVLEGSIEMVLDSGEVVTLRRGDVAVQRGTMHAWRNPSSSEWARMMFVLLDSQPIEIGGESLSESLGSHSDIRPSNN